MKSLQIAFIGRNTEAAFNSIIQTSNNYNSGLIVVYSDKSKETWQKIKGKLKPLFKHIESRKIEFNDIGEVFKLISNINNIESGEKNINITGLSKEGMLAILLFYAMHPKDAYKTKILVYQENNKKIIFPPIIFFALGCNNKRKQKILKSKVLKQLSIKDNITITELTKITKKAKSTISEIVNLLERERLVEKIREGRNVKVKLTEFGKFLIQIKEIGR